MPSLVAGWLAVADHAGTRGVLPGGFPAGWRVVRHASGRPWLAYGGSVDELTVAEAGAVRVAVIGTCSVTAPRLSELVAHVRAVEHLDRLARVLVGCWHLVASVDGVVRAQGGLSGLRAVFHTRVGDLAVAGDRADTLAALSGAGLDERALALRVACSGPAPPPASEQSYWQGIKALAPDHYLRLSGDGSATQMPWWRPPEPESSLRVGASRVREALRDAVAARRPSGGRLSGDLSGGLDSTSLCFLAARTVTPELLTLRWAEAEQANDDAVFAAHAADMLPQAEHLVLAQASLPAKFANPGDLGDSEAPYRFGRTLARTRHDCALLGAHGSRVHLAGHGGDELFVGSPAYLHTLLRRRPLAAIGRIRAYRALGRWPLAATWSGLSNGEDIATWWRRQANTLAAGPPPRRSPRLGWGLPIRAAPWVSPAALDIARVGLRAIADLAAPLAPDRGQHATLASARRSGPSYRQLVRLYTGAGVHLELPYLDDRVIESVLAVRLDERSSPWRFKPLLGEAMRGVLPDLVAARTTKGEFSQDVRRGLRQHLPDLLDLFADSTLAARGLIDPDVLRRSLLAPHVDWTAMFAMEDLLGCETWARAARTTQTAPLRREV